MRIEISAAVKEQEARQRELFQLSVRMGGEPPLSGDNVVQLLMWRFTVPFEIKMFVADLIRRNALTWRDVFEDGNITWAMRPRIGWH
jgi:hypothetical protein